jgi:hypothetical protein
MPSPKLPIGDSKAVLEFAELAREANRAFEQFGVTERYSYDLSRGPGPDGERIFWVTLSHSRIEREALRTVLEALSKIRKSGGLTASGAQMLTTDGISKTIEQMRTLGALRTFGDREVRTVAQAEHVLMRRRRRVNRRALYASALPPRRSRAYLRRMAEFDDERAAKRAAAGL